MLPFSATTPTAFLPRHPPPTTQGPGNEEKWRQAQGTEKYYGRRGGWLTDRSVRLTSCFPQKKRKRQTAALFQFSFSFSLQQYFIQVIVTFTRSSTTTDNITYGYIAYLYVFPFLLFNWTALPSYPTTVFSYTLSSTTSAFVVFKDQPTPFLLSHNYLMLEKKPTKRC